MGWMGNSYRFGSGGGAPTTPSEMVFGHIEGDFSQMNVGTGDTWSAFDGDIDETFPYCAFGTTSGPSEIGYDFSWAYPSGTTITKIELWGSSNEGYIRSGNPTDTRWTLYGWDGSWNAIGNTGDFTDGMVADKRTITSTDTTTLFTKWKVILTYTGALSSRLAEMKCYTAGDVQILVPNIDGKNITPAIETNAAWGRSQNIVNGTDHNPETDCLASAGANTTDLVVPMTFDIARPVDKVVCYSSSDDGFFNGSNPTDMQIDLEGYNGSTWDALGDTGTFTDANSLAKTITSSDQATLFEAIRISISSASTQRKILSQLRVHVFI